MSASDDGANKKRLLGRTLMRELVINVKESTKNGYFFNVCQSPTVASAPELVNKAYDCSNKQETELAPWVKIQQRSLKTACVMFPVTFCTGLIEYFSKSEEITEVNGAKVITYNLSKLEPFVTTDSYLNVSLNLKNEGENFYMTSKCAEASDPDCPTEQKLQIRREFVPNLMRFLGDIVTRYLRKVEPKPKSLYVPSGERHFYFDLKNTIFGRRLMVSQVTVNSNRSTISFPLESLVDVRDALNEIIAECNLEDGNDTRHLLHQQSQHTVRRRRQHPNQEDNSITSSRRRHSPNSAGCATRPGS